MNWLEKIKKLTTKKDNSPELKKGEIKQILIQTANNVLPDFEFLAYKNNCYIFQRLKELNDRAVYETLHITFSLKEKKFACSAASRLNPKYIFVNLYNTGLINPHIDLKVMRHNSGALSIQDAYYFHNGQVETTTNIVRELFLDYKNYGLPFLDKQFEKLQKSELIKVGLDYIDNLNVNKETLKKEIAQDLEKGGHTISSIKHPLYINLKLQLQAVSGQTREDRQLIPKAAHELLEIYIEE